MTAPRILIIDDDPDHLLVCALIFERQNYIVRSLPGCHPLKDFITEVRKFQPDLIFIDQDMPGVCGADAIKELRSETDLTAIPIIYFSANSELEELARKTGADDYIQKPFKIDQLLALARKYSERPAA